MYQLTDTESMIIISMEMLIRNIKQNSLSSDNITVSYKANINVGCKLKKKPFDNAEH